MKLCSPISTKNYGDKPADEFNERRPATLSQKLWNLCHILRDDGITYNEYVTELTFLLFLKMMAETGREDVLPNGYRWSQLTKRNGLEQLDYYRACCSISAMRRGKATSSSCDFRRMRRPSSASRPISRR